MTSPKEIRTRIAPSPTGDPHIGTAYQLLFDYAFAKSQGGKCILRIEDTDQVRSSAESERAILESLRWLGLTWDEGPDVGGPHGPYRQSERTEIYREHCQKLLDSGHAYRCFCTPERLEKLRREQKIRKEPPGYDKYCANLSEEEIQRKLDEGLPFTVRMRVPTEGDCVIHDRLRGEIRTPWRNVDDQVLMKSDGFPTYHLANVVDDHLMGITDVIRGEEWISSAPKHKLLYEHFGWEMPTLCHLPLLRNPDKSKLSKRKNPTSIFYYRDAGFLAEAVLNYLGLMSYTLPDGREMFTLEEMVESFDIGRVSLGGPIFDVVKLKWLNGRYLRENLTADDFLEHLKHWKFNDETLKEIIPLAQSRIETLADFLPLTGLFFTDQPDYEAEKLIPKKLEGDETARIVRIFQWEMEKLPEWKAESLQAIMKKIADTEGHKMRDIVSPFFVALSGSPQSTPLFDSMVVLGRDLVRRRLMKALDKLAELGFSLSKKKTKELEKYYAEKYVANE